MEASGAPRRLFFPLVDALRAFAALTVLVYHLIAHWDWQSFPASGPLAWFRGGWMAVDLFFVMSGFVIGLSAFSRLDVQGAGFRAGFLRNRLARIVPLHYLTLVAYVLLIEPSLWGRPDFWPDVLAHLLFIHNTVPAYFGAINGPNWSIGTEMQFYLLMALAAPWLCRTRPWRFAVLFVAIAWAWRWGAHALLLPGPLDRAYMAQTQLPGMLDEFAIGLLLARFVRAPAGQAFLARIATDPRTRIACVALAAACWWALLAIYLGHDYWEVPAMAVFFRTGVASCAAVSLLLLCGWPQPKHRAVVRAALYLGKASYGIYLWHLPVLFFLGRHTRLEPLAALLVAAPATVGLAALTWHLVEKPLLRRWSEPRSGPARPIAPRVAGAAVLD
ncbi:MAG: acyltransferase family protein [Ramlibacter sp.]